MSEEKIEITKCPICEKKHVYNLKIERIIVLYNMSLEIPRTNKMDKSKPRRFTRLFVCPVKNEMFQASFTLYGNFGEIKSVKVKGIISDETK